MHATDELQAGEGPVQGEEANSDRLQPMDHRDDAADAPLPYPFLWRPRRDGAADHSDRTELSPSEASEVSAPPASPSLPNRVA